MQELLEEREAWLEQRKGWFEDVKVGRIEAVRPNDQLQLLKDPYSSMGTDRNPGNLLHRVYKLLEVGRIAKSFWKKRNDRKVLRRRHRRGIFHVLAVR